MVRFLKTKKMLAPVDIEFPNKDIQGFLCPKKGENIINSFFEIGSGKEWKYGRVVYVGKEISESDISARILASGKQAESDLSKIISLYIEQINSYKIGTVVFIKPVE